MNTRMFINRYAVFIFLFISFVGYVITNAVPAFQSFAELKKGADAQKNGDYSHAMGFYLESANKGNPIAEQDIAILYAKGNGVTKNYQEAMKWLLKSQEHGNKNAAILISQLQKLMTK